MTSSRSADGHPVIDLVLRGGKPHQRRSVGWEEFWSWPKADRGMLRVLRKIRTEGTDEWIDPERNDMLIAATAIAHGVPLGTQDQDYVDVPGLEVIRV